MPRDQKVIESRVLMDEKSIEKNIQRMAQEIQRDLPDPSEVILFGLASRGVPIAEKLGVELETLYSKKLMIGQLDATFYRDDFHFRNKLKNPSLKVDALTVSLDNKQVILVDDVLYTGRSVRAAMNAIMDLGRPSSIKFLCLVDRGHRELPIEANYVGIQSKTQAFEEVRVSIEPIDKRNCVELVKIEDDK